MLKFVDDSKVLTKTSSEEDVIKLQEDLSTIYSWASRNNMKWNDLKFQILRLGRNEELKENTIIFSPNYQEVIDRKEVIKDLGILVDQDLSYKAQYDTALSKTKQKYSWVLRTFSTCEPEFLRIMWNSLIQCHLDYGSILWAPYTVKKYLKNMENTLRTFSKRAKGLYNADYWTRLKILKLNSIQRRVDRYRIFYSWKSLNGYTPSLGMKWSDSTCRHNGRI